MVDYLAAQEIQDYYSRGMTSIIVPKINQEITNIIKKAKATGKKEGIFAGNFKETEQWLTDGMDMVVINSELGLMGQIIKTNLNKLKEAL